MIDPSPQVESLLNDIAAQQSESPSLSAPGFASASAGLFDTARAVMERESEFPDPLIAKLTGIALDPYARQLAERHLDAGWSDEELRRIRLASTTRSSLDASGEPPREVIIGGGFHAAVYAAIRVLSGHPRPLVLERGERAGGTFAMTGRAVFTLNSRNRAGLGGPVGDLGASPNFLPGALVQAANLSMAEYQTNTDMALVIRLALAQFADVVTGARVLSVTRDTTTTPSPTGPVTGPAAEPGSGPGAGADAGVRMEIEVEGLAPLLAGRVIDARGLGDPVDQAVCDGRAILTFAQFMQRMAEPWPLRGIRRVAVIGGGDSAKCTVESLLGIGPQPPMAAAALDSLDLIDWYAERLPTSCELWQQGVRGRYQAIGPALRQDRLGRRRLQVLTRRARPVALPGMALVDGRSYDLVVLCTGNRETPLPGLESDAFDEYPRFNASPTADPVADPIARKHFALPAWRVGPHARLPFTARERQDGVADIAANAVSMFRTAAKTAALAAALPS